MSNASDFVIENGVLTKYVGPGGDVVVPEYVTEIGDGAFEGNKYIASVAIPDSVKTIGEKAFEGCIKLKRAVLPAGLHIIQEATFQNCVNLEEVVFPKKLKYIGRDAFRKNSRLQSVILPEGVTEIGENAFKDCGGLSKYGPVKEIVLPSSVHSIRSGAFACPIKRLVFNGNDPIIWKKAFTRTIGTLIIGSDIQKIAAKTFDIWYYDAIGEIRFLSHETKIADTAFTGYAIPALVRAVYPKQISTKMRKEIATDVADLILAGQAPSEEYIALWLKSFKSLKNTLEDIAGEHTALCTLMLQEKILSVNTARTLLRTATDNSLKIRLLEYIHGFGVGEDQTTEELDLDRVPTLAEVRKRFKIDIRDGKATITGYKSAEEQVIIPPVAGKTPITAIAEKAFKGNNCIKSVLIPEGVISIGAEAFSSCKNLSHISIPESAMKIGAKAFHGFKRLESPDGFTIVNGILVDYSGPGGDVTVPEGVRVIAGGESTGAFSWCSKLNNVSLPEGLEEIGENAFSDCRKMASINLPDSVRTIAPLAFDWCMSLRNISIPRQVEKIERAAFANCSSLTSITLLEGVSIISSYAFNGCSDLTSVTIPDSVVAIGEEAFGGCNSLTSMTVLGDATGFGDNALPFEYDANNWYHHIYRLTIHASAHSRAARYAKENNIPFVAE